jgi:hypothetical protein
MITPCIQANLTRLITSAGLILHNPRLKSPSKRPITSANILPTIASKTDEDDRIYRSRADSLMVTGGMVVT